MNEGSTSTSHAYKDLNSNVVAEVHVGKGVKLVDLALTSQKNQYNMVALRKAIDENLNQKIQMKLLRYEAL